MKEVNIISKVVGRRGAEASPSSAIIPNMSGYATKSELNTLRDEFKDFLEGADADVIINKWQDLVSFLEGISEDFDLLSMLGLKADKSELSNYVTIATEQTISAHKDFLNGLSIGGLSITKSQDDVVYIDANLVVRGGITMFGTNSVDVPTIMDAIATDGVNLKVVDGVLTFVGSSGGGLSEVYWDDVIGRPTLLSSFIDDVGYLQKSGGQMTGNIGYTLTPDSYDVGLPAAGTIDSLVGIDKLNSYKSFFGSVHLSDDWYYALSIRHRNGRDDGNNYGLLLYTTFSQSGNLEWDRQENGIWKGNRVILDSGNWSQYVTAADGGNYLPITGGSLSGNLNVNGVVYFDYSSYVGKGSPSEDTLYLFSNDTVRLVATYTTFPVNLDYYGYNDAAYIDFKGASGTYLRDKYGTSQLIINTAYTILGYDNPVIGNPTYIDGLNVYIRHGANHSNYSCFQSNGTVHVPSIIKFGKYSESTNTNTDIGYIGRGSDDGRLILWCDDDFDIFVNANVTRAAKFSNSNLLVSGGITMYSDQRKKTILNHVELSLKQIAEAPLIEHYYNSDEKRTTHVGSIAQYWASMNDWFCKLDSEGYYTMEIQNAALASAISIARELVKYESKTDRKIRLLKDRVKELEDKIEKLENN